MTRFCVNLIFLGRWLIFWSGWTKSIDTRDYNRELNDCLLQLWKIEYQSPSSSLSLFNLFISTINTSMNSGKKMDIQKRNEIYLLSALTLQQLGGIFGLFIPYALKCLLITDMKDFWLADTERLSEFIHEKKSMNFNEKNFLESIRFQYFEYTLLDCIEHQLRFQEHIPNPPMTNQSCAEFDRFTWWQHSLQVIRCISNDEQSIDNLLSSDFLRENNQSQQTVYQMARERKLVE